MLAQFYHIFRNYADDILSLMSTHAMSEVKRYFEKDSSITTKSPEFQHMYAKTWRDFLKHSRTWDRKLLDQEVVRILKSMAGLVADLDSDSESSEDEDEDLGDAVELSSYRDTLQTYLEYARWTLMSSLTDSNVDPVDDIPAVALSDFVCYFVDTLTRQRAVKKNLFLSYDELNQSHVIRPCLVNAIKRTIPQSVYQALLKAKLENTKSRYRNRGRNSAVSTSTSQSLRSTGSRRPLVASGLLQSDMMSSRAIAARMNTDSLRNTMASSASSVAMPQTTPRPTPKSRNTNRDEIKQPANRDEIAQPANRDETEQPANRDETEQNVEPEDVKKDTEPRDEKMPPRPKIDTSKIEPVKNVDLDDQEDVRQVNLDESMQTNDYQSTSAAQDAP